MDSEPVLKLKEVTKYYPVTKGLLFARTIGHVRAVDRVTLDLDQGETLALVGESGCGKTTTAKLILRQETPTSGKLEFEGQDVHRITGAALKQYRTDVQAVFQDPWSSLNPRMRVFDIVSETLVVNHAVAKGEVADRVAKVLSDVGLRTEQSRNFPHEFSGGQRQRIAIASALISEPKLLVLDEPVSALDVSIRSQIMNLFKDLQDLYRMSYLMVAHDLGTTRYMAHKVAVMYLGQLVELAPTRSLFEAPLHPYTQALFSAALPSHPDIEREEIILEGEVPSPIDPPSGCSFHTRCPLKIGEVCEKETPELTPRPDDSQHHVACHLYTREPSRSPGDGEGKRV